MTLSRLKAYDRISRKLIPQEIHHRIEDAASCAGSLSDAGFRVYMRIYFQRGHGLCAREQEATESKETMRRLDRLRGSLTVQHLLLELAGCSSGRIDCARFSTAAA
jgi:hypothetical protein